ncbi:MAG: hypothetical protein N3F65_04420 [Nitrososphaeria archaeon]|nr:hypothetical protein [Nitrososphaeria archaeon]
MGDRDDDFWRNMVAEHLRSGKFLIFNGGAYVAERDPAVMGQIAGAIGLSASTEGAAFSNYTTYTEPPT